MVHLFLQDVFAVSNTFLGHCETDNGTSNLICFSILLEWFAINL